MESRALKRLLEGREQPGDAAFAVSSPTGAASDSIFVQSLRAVLLDAGHPEAPAADARLVLHVVDPAEPRPFRRRHRATFVVAIVVLPTMPAEALPVAYPYLVRALANLCVLVARDAPAEARVVTLEQGHYRVDLTRNGRIDLAALYDHLRPLALSRLVIENDFVRDLPPELWSGDVHTRALARAGHQLDALGLLPAPFPLETYLDERERRHVMRLYGIGGLSYGNMSARRDRESFWMTASGANKGALARIGEDIVLIGDLDPERLALRVSVPTGLVRPARASVDAIEHWMIYRRHPSIRAIVHVHAWLDGVRATEVNYPCGTIELASAVAEMVGSAPDPGCAVVGQKNHGLTLTGRSLENIFQRLAVGTARTVPMAA